MKKNCSYCSKEIERYRERINYSCSDCYRLRNTIAVRKYKLLNKKVNKRQFKKNVLIIKEKERGMFEAERDHFTRRYVFDNYAEIEQKRKYFHTKNYIEKKTSEIRIMSLNLLTGIEKEDLKTLKNIDKLMIDKILLKNGLSYLK